LTIRFLSTPEIVIEKSLLVVEKLPPTAVNLLAKINDHQTRRTLTLLFITNGELCLNNTRYFIPSQKSVDELKKVLPLIWDELQQDLINTVILIFTKRLQACMKGGMDI